MPVSAAEGLHDEFKTQSPLRQIPWLLVTVYGMPIDDVNLTLDLVAPLRTAPLPQLLKKLKRTSTYVVEGIDPPQLQDYAVPQICREPSPPLSEQDAVRQRTEPEPQVRHSEAQAQESRSTASSSHESARTFQVIYGAFKGRKFTGDSLQSIQESIRDYNILSFQLGLSEEMKAKFFICIFEDAAKSHFISNVREEMSYAEIEKIMRAEFESDARRLEVHMTIRSLRIESAVSQNEDVTNDSESLNWLVMRINRLTPQFPEGFRSEENKMQFLRDAVIGREWASQAISQITTSKYSFSGFVSALREVLQYSEELRRHKRVSSPSFGKDFGPLLYQQYGQPPRSVSKFKPRLSQHNAPRRMGILPRRNSLDRSGKRMRCHLCGSDSHLQRFHSEAIKQENRHRLASRENSIHIISDLVNGIDEMVLKQDTDIPDVNCGMGTEDYAETAENLESVNLFDQLTSSYSDEKETAPPDNTSEYAE